MTAYLAAFHDTRGKDSHRTAIGHNPINLRNRLQEPRRTDTSFTSYNESRSFQSARA